MKFSLLSGLSLLSLSIGTFAAPTSAPVNEVAAPGLEKRATLHQAILITSNLYSEIKTYTGALNATSASITPSSSKADKAVAKAAAGKEIAGITAAIRAATKQIKASKTSAALTVRQAGGAGDLATLVSNIILEISGALNGIIADLGLDPLLSFLNPLLSALSGLLLSLVPVVNNLLALVEALLDGLLTGLAAGLAGLLT